MAAAADAVVSSRGLVSAVAYQDGAPLIEIAGQRFALDQVRRIDIAQ